uniref:Uncharacterized protein n=1 Tax=Rhizophora mucronata TaxID=61149 RepID=A0A2P2Q4Z2_RHIMU
MPDFLIHELPYLDVIHIFSSFYWLNNQEGNCLKLSGLSSSILLTRQFSQIPKGVRPSFCSLFSPCCIT